jgi:hypothetical protein
MLVTAKPKPNRYPNEISSLGDHLRKTRLDRGLLQGDVAKQIEVSNSRLRKQGSDCSL